MFLSDVFANVFATTTGCLLELYNTDGAQGAARAAGVGAGVFSDFAESFKGMEIIRRIEPRSRLQDQYGEIYQIWKVHLSSVIEKKSLQ